MRLNLFAQALLGVVIILGFATVLLGVLTAMEQSQLNQDTTKVQTPIPYLLKIASVRLANIADIGADTDKLKDKKELVGWGGPTQLRIPSLGIDVAIESVGMTPEGDVGSPKGPTNPAWFSLGARPGERGSAVIVGHYGWNSGVHAVFDNISSLLPGDKVYVVDAIGATHTFVVREIQEYMEGELVEKVFVAGDDAAHLNLISCGGVWDKVQKSYAHRVVVYTDKVHE